MIFYDELGSGHSDHPADTSLWHVDKFVQRLARLRRALGLTQAHLYGHSFGTVIATEYVLTRPGGVRSLILGGPALDFARVRHDRDSLRATLPDSIQRILDSSFIAYSRHTIPHQMLTGPGGDLVRYSCVDRLGEITVPTLFTVGRYDFTTPATAAYHQHLVPGAELVVFEHSAHLTMQDEPQRYVAVLRDFLDHVEQR